MKRQRSDRRSRRRANRRLERSQPYTILITRSGRDPVMLSLPPRRLFSLLGICVALPTIVLGGVLVSMATRNIQLSARHDRLTSDAVDILHRLEALESTLSLLQQRARLSPDPSAPLDPFATDSLEASHSELDSDTAFDPAALDPAETGSLPWEQALGQAKEWHGSGAADQSSLDKQEISTPDEDARQGQFSPAMVPLAPADALESLEPSAPLDPQAGSPDPDLHSDRQKEATEGLRAVNYPRSQGEAGNDIENEIEGEEIEVERLLTLAHAKLPDLIKVLEQDVQPVLEEIIVRVDARPQGLPLHHPDMAVTSRYGWRPSPFGGGDEFHQGIDFVADYGVPIQVTAAGTVETAEWEPGYGNHVIVDHGYGLQTLYAHLSEVTVKVGDRLAAAQIVGYLGNSGRSSGPHLHYGVYQNSKPVDPQRFLN